MVTERAKKKKPKKTNEPSEMGHSFVKHSIDNFTRYNYK